VVKVLDDSGELGAVGPCRRTCGEVSGELGVLLMQGLQARVEGGHALGEALGAEVAGLKRVVVAGERALGLLDLLGERGAALGEARVLTLALRRRALNRLVDRSPAMLARAVAKGLDTAEADAQDLPFEDESFDAVTMISMLHHVEDRGAALAEARRILKPDGRLVVAGFTAEDARSLWILDYFPSSRSWMEATHPPRATILEELRDAELIAFQIHDMPYASLAALSADPERVLQAAERAEASYFERLQRDHPDELRAGLDQLREEIAAGRAPKRAGTATILSWTKP
jgi:SAM-dependent methyltransferase